MENNKRRQNTIFQRVHGISKQFIIILLLLNGCTFFRLTTSGKISQNLRQAEKFALEGNHEEAIKLYRLHIDSRLADSKRKDWENPYFYLLIIGDLYLENQKEAEAIASYRLAEANNVEKPLVADRYRKVAQWYEDNNRLKDAIEFLQSERDIDSLLIDNMLDRMSRKLIDQEEHG